MMEAYRSALQTDLLYAMQFGMDSNIHLLQISRVVEEDLNYYQSIEFCPVPPDNPAEAAEQRIALIYPTDLTQHFLDNLNAVLENMGHDLAIYGLTLPITMEDVVNRRENMQDLLYNYPESIHHRVFQSGYAYPSQLDQST